MWKLFLILIKNIGSALCVLIVVYMLEMGVIGRPVPQKVAKEARTLWDQEHSVAVREHAQRDYGSLKMDMPAEKVVVVTSPE